MNDCFKRPFKPKWASFIQCIVPVKWQWRTGAIKCIGFVFHWNSLMPLSNDLASYFPSYDFIWRKCHSCCFCSEFGISSFWSNNTNWLFIMAKRMWKTCRCIFSSISKHGNKWWLYNTTTRKREGKKNLQEMFEKVGYNN